MTYTINGVEHTEFYINQRCAELLGLIVQTEFQDFIGFTEMFHEAYPNTVWCAEVDEIGVQVGAWEQMVFTRYPENTWTIIEKCWDELNVLYANGVTKVITKWQRAIEKHKCTKLIAACICYIEIKEGKL